MCGINVSIKAGNLKACGWSSNTLWLLQLLPSHRAFTPLASGTTEVWVLYKCHLSHGLPLGWKTPTPSYMCLRMKDGYIIWLPLFSSNHSKEPPAHTRDIIYRCHLHEYFTEKALSRWICFICHVRRVGGCALDYKYWWNIISVWAWVCIVCVVCYHHCRWLLTYSDFLQIPYLGLTKYILSYYCILCSNNKRETK